MNQLDLRERVAIITGGARGIGYAAAQRALRSGASVVLWDIDSARVERAVAELAPLGDGHRGDCRAQRRRRRRRRDRRDPRAARPD